MEKKESNTEINPDVFVALIQNYTYVLERGAHSP